MIRVLSDDTIQKIAAGEVVERPASIVKELVENSIDAGSTKIIVEIREGGKSYIKVSDNGHGIEKDDIELAFTRHATSKIESFDDLYKIYSMGFRGEALASIVSVSKIIMRTKTDKDIVGTIVEYDNNKLISSKSIGMNTGTIIEVFDLFKYIPARKKFLSTDITESNKITNLMYSFAIGHPEISFTYIKDNREVFNTIISDDKNINYEILFGKDFVKNLINVKFNSKNYSIEGAISNNKYYKGNRSMQFIYVNGRYIENDQIVEAIESAYINLIPSGRFPLYELKISVNPDLIDINIHPNKQKIKFSFSEELINLLKDNISQLLYKNEETKNISLKEENQKIKFHQLNEGDGYKKILDIYKEPVIFNKSNLLENKDNIEEDRIEKSFYLNNPIINFNTLDKEEKYIDEKIDDINENVISVNETQQINFIENNLEFKSIIFNKYILFEDIENNKLIFIDIIRANQRILYDREINNKKIVSQDLIEPYTINLTNKELDLFDQNKEYFNNMGYEIDIFSSNAIIIRAIPYFIDKPTNKEDFLMLLDEVSSDKILDKNDYLLKKSLSISINKKTNLSEEEANSLYKELIKSSNKNTSPHGKSIIFEISNDTLIRMLK